MLLTLAKIGKNFCNKHEYLKFFGCRDQNSGLFSMFARTTKERDEAGSINCSFFQVIRSTFAGQHTDFFLNRCEKYFGELNSICPASTLMAMPGWKSRFFFTSLRRMPLINPMTAFPRHTPFICRPRLNAPSFYPSSSNEQPFDAWREQVIRLAFRRLPSGEKARKSEPLPERQTYTSYFSIDSTPVPNTGGTRHQDSRGPKASNYK